MGRARKGEEDWSGVTDLRKRKQIQDRLAQRARRNRLKEATTCNSTPPDPTSAADCCASNQNTPNMQSEEEGLQLMLFNHYDGDATNNRGDGVVWGQIKTRPFSALRQNGVILGLRCSAATTDRSLPAGPEIPEALRPTPLQLSVPHATWIDRFPFPQFRDNLIRLWGLIDEEDFLSDLFCLPSFTIAPGAASWDPSAWEVGNEFSAKWGYLFF